MYLFTYLILTYSLQYLFIYLFTYFLTYFITSLLNMISSPDLVLAFEDKKGGGGGEGERSKRDLVIYESKRALIACSIMHAKAPCACIFLLLTVPKKFCEKN